MPGKVRDNILQEVLHRPEHLHKGSDGERGRIFRMDKPQNKKTMEG